jgi:hypothetical protein
LGQTGTSNRPNMQEAETKAPGLGGEAARFHLKLS